MKRFDGKTALITGGASGIGKAITNRLKDEGAAVYTAQAMIAMFVRNVININGRGLIGGVIATAIFSLPMIALWRSKKLFSASI